LSAQEKSAAGPSESFSANHKKLGALLSDLSLIGAGSPHVRADFALALANAAQLRAALL